MSRGAGDYNDLTLMAALIGTETGFKLAEVISSGVLAVITCFAETLAAGAKQAQEKALNACNGVGWLGVFTIVNIIVDIVVDVNFDNT